MTICRKNEEELAAQLVGFMQQFLNVFKELEGKNLYLSGESVCPPPKLFERRKFSFGCKQYAGTYLPCLSQSLLLVLSDIADYIHNHKNLLSFDLQGMWIADRRDTYSYQLHMLTVESALLSYILVQSVIPAVLFVHKYENVFAFKYVGPHPICFFFVSVAILYTLTHVIKQNPHGST